MNSDGYFKIIKKSFEFYERVSLKLIEKNLDDPDYIDGYELYHILLDSDKEPSIGSIKVYKMIPNILRYDVSLFNEKFFYERYPSNHPVLGIKEVNLESVKGYVCERLKQIRDRINNHYSDEEKEELEAYNKHLKSSTIVALEDLKKYTEKQLEGIMSNYENITKFLKELER